MTTKQKRKGFGTIGVVLATAGSAIGLGNIWKFPYILGQNGGAAWLVIYLVCVALFGIPIMIAEMYIGKSGQKDRWKWIQGWSVALCILLLGFYTVVTGWCLEYLHLSMQGHFAGKSPEVLKLEFEAFSSGKLWPAIWMTIALMLSSMIEWAGVEKGIERMSKMLMPFLLVILVLLIGKSLTLDGSTVGVRFLMWPDWEKFSIGSILNAMGQCFFSLSVGMGILVAYSSYMQKQQNIPRTAMQVAILDTIVALMAGVAIFPAVFALGIDPTEGPELVFVTLPSVFAQMTAGSVFATLFFLLMSIAAITSLVSIMEVIVAWMKDKTRWTRHKRMLVIVPTIWLLGMLCILLPNCFNLFDSLTSKMMIPAGALLSAWVVGWKVNKEDFIREMTTHGGLQAWMVQLILLMLRWLTPVIILIIFVTGLV